MSISDKLMSLDVSVTSDLGTTYTGINSGSYGSNALMKFQDMALDATEKIIQYRHDYDYKRAKVRQPVTQIGTFQMAFSSDIDLVTPANNLPQISILITHASTYVVSEGDPPVLSTLPIGTPYGSGSTYGSVTWSGNIVTMTRYAIPGGPTINRQISFDYTRPLTDVNQFVTDLSPANPLLSPSPIDTIPYGAIFSSSGLNLQMNDLTGNTLLGQLIPGSPNPPTDNIYKFEVPSGIINTSTSGNVNLFFELNIGNTNGPSFENKGEFGNFQFAITNFTTGGLPLYLFKVPSSYTQTEVPSADLLKEFLLKNNDLTEGTPTVITSTLTVAYITQLAEELFKYFSKVSENIDSSVTGELLTYKSSKSISSIKNKYLISSGIS